MAMKRGFKQTEAGVIPKDWRLSNLSELSAFITKGSTPTTYGFKWESSGVLFLRSECVAETGLDLSQSTFISKSAHASLRRSAVREGDLLVTITGYVGRVVVFKHSEDANINQHIARVRVISPHVCSRFVFHYLTLPQVRSRFNAITTGQAYPQISLKQVRDIEIPFPPTKVEQEAIAEALGDADALTESLEQLLAKKRQVKEGAMEVLLLGKKRLPGFSGQWEARPLGAEISALEAGVSVNSTDDGADLDSGDPAILKTSCVDRGVFTPSECKKISLRDVCRARLNPQANRILISRMNTIDLVGECGYVETDYPSLFVPDRLWMTRFRKTSQVSAKWLNYTLSSEHYRTLLKAAATGTSGSMKNIAKGSLLSLEITFPRAEEQNAIAAILSDMDAEIIALEAKLTKARQIKQGMMQELLTGRIRLV